MNRALGEFGIPWAFSVNIDPKLIAAGHASKRGLRDYLRRRVALGLKRVLGRSLPFWLNVETDDHGREHVHGGIALSDDEVPAWVGMVLAKAGGAWKRPGSAPAFLRVQDDPDGWAAYCFKRFERTRHDLREAAGLAPGARVPLLSYTDDLRAAGQRVHAETRKSLGRR